MLRKFFASLATVALAIGIVATAPLSAQAGNPANTNDPANWVAVTGETCVNWDSPGSTSLSYADLVSHFGLSGKTITKVIIKAASSTGGAVDYENTAYYEDATYKLTIDSTWWIQTTLSTTSFVHVDGLSGASGKNISHAIVCYTTPAPTSVTGDVTQGDQTCDDDEYVSGWIEPVAKTGVSYELYASDKTTVVAAPFTTQTAVAPGTYWVKVISTDASLYTVAEENTWIQVTIGAYEGECAGPQDVTGDVNSADQTCTVEYAFESGWIEPVAVTGVAYELYASDKTTVIAASFTTRVEVPAGTYWVRVTSLDTDLYTVTQEWIEVTVGDYDGLCDNRVKVIGDPFDFQECVPNDDLKLTSTWVATLTIDTADTEPTGSVQYRVFVWDGTDYVDQGIWQEGVYYAGTDFPYTKVKVVAEAVGDYVLQDGVQTEWLFDFSDPFDCNLTDFGIVTPLVTFSATCSASPTYTLAIAGGLPGTVLWSVNGGSQTTQLGTFAAPGTTVTVVASPAPGSGFDGDGLPRTFSKTFTAPEACGDLTTLALTGNNVSGLLWVTALLGLLGTALIRAGRRQGRNAVEG